MYQKIACFFLLIIAFSKVADAQFGKGTRMIGGSISGSFSSGKTEFEYAIPAGGTYTSNTNLLALDLTPSIGWFLSDKTAVGLRLNGGYRYDKYIDTESDVTFRKTENTYLNFTLGGFARYYFSTTGKFYPFGQASIDAGFVSSDTKGFLYTSTYKENFDGKSSGGFLAKGGLQVGLTKMLSSSVGLDIFAGYTYLHQKLKVKTTTIRDIDIDGTIDETEIEDITSTIRNHVFTFGFGLQVFLGKK